MRKNVHSTLKSWFENTSYAIKTLDYFQNGSKISPTEIAYVYLLIPWVWKNNFYAVMINEWNKYQIFCFNKLNKNMSATLGLEF